MNAPLIHMRGVAKHFGSKAVLQGLDWQVGAGQVIGLLGRNGAGKSTLMECLLGLRELDAGSASLFGEPVDRLSEATRARIGYVPQKSELFGWMTPVQLLDYFKALYPRWNGAKVEGLLERWGFDPLMRSQPIHRLSGGEQQRLSIIRALAHDPELLVLDEPVSALDVSIQAGVINLLEDLQGELGLAFMFISHDLSVIRHIANRVVVMYLGKVVETADVDELFKRPCHPYTQALMSAIPLPDPVKERERERIVLAGDVPSPVNPPSGCRFRTRCQKFALDLDNQQREWCVNVEPPLEAKFPAHSAACHFAEVRTDILGDEQARTERPTLVQWPTGRPSDELASAPPSCMPDAGPQTPQRLTADTEVNEEGELVIEPES